MAVGFGDRPIFLEIFKPKNAIYQNILQDTPLLCNKIFKLWIRSLARISHISSYETYRFVLIYTNWGFGCLKTLSSPQFYMLICPLNQLRTKPYSLHTQFCNLEEISVHLQGNIYDMVIKAYHYVLYGL